MTQRGLSLGLFLGYALFATGCGDDPVPLQVDFAWTSFCEPSGCGTVPHELAGQDGDPIPELASGQLGVACEIVEVDNRAILTSLKVQDRSTEVQPRQGINLRNGAIAVGSSMSCGEDAFEMFDENEFVGSCAGLSDGSCAILVQEYQKSSGRLVLEMDCQNLRPLAGTTRRSLRQGLLTIQGCNVVNDS